MKFKIFTLFLLTALFSSCSSNKTTIESMNDDSRPSWADLSKSTWKSGGKVWALGFTEADVNSNLASVARISDNNAKTELTRLISNDIGVSYQNISEGNADLSRFIGTERSQVLAQEITPENRYYEKVMWKGEGDSKTYKLQYYSLISIPESAYLKLLNEYKPSKRNVATEKISPEAQKIADEQLKEMTEIKPE